MSSVADALVEKGIHADRDGLHLLPPEQLQQSVALQEECKEFISKTKQFNEIVADFITVMEGKSKVLQHACPRPLAFTAPAPTCLSFAPQPHQPPPTPPPKSERGGCP